MPQQIFIIHGGDAFDTYEQYVAYLKSKKVTLEKLRSRRGWKDTLGKALGTRAEVFNPRMPNANNAKYAEWKLWFEKIIPLMKPGVILIGHSLGGIFLAKYLSEETFPKKIKATFLVAAPFNSATQHPLADFNLSGSLEKFERQGGKIFLYHSTGDKIVPFSNVKMYRAGLPSATLRAFSGRGHFLEERFPELEKDVKSLL